MAYFGVITGAPCSGKSTYVQKAKVADDLVMDLDAIHQALGSRHTHSHQRFLLPYALSAHLGILEAVPRRSDAPNVWYVTCWPTPEELALSPSHVYELRMPATKEDCLQRAIEAGRSPETALFIERWFRAHGSERLFSKAT